MQITHCRDLLELHVLVIYKTSNCLPGPQKTQRRNSRTKRSGGFSQMNADNRRRWLLSNLACDPELLVKIGENCHLAMGQNPW